MLIYCHCLIIVLSKCCPLSACCFVLSCCLHAAPDGLPTERCWGHEETLQIVSCGQSLDHLHTIALVRPGQLQLPVVLSLQTIHPQSSRCGHYHHLLHYDTVWVGPSISVSWHSLLGLIILNLEEEFVLKNAANLYYRILKMTATCFDQIPALMNVGVWIIVESIMDRTLSKFSLNVQGIKINFIL